jgi:hypothetical protein
VLRALIRRLFAHGEGGQVLILAAVTIPIVAGMAGIAVDTGSYASNRRTLQNAADSIALAAAQELPDESAAIAAGNTWAAKNGIASGTYTLSISGGAVSPAATVTITRSHKFAFLGLLGVSSKDVSSRAVATKNSYGGGSGIVPWAVTQATVDAAENGAQIVMKYDSTGAENGNFGAIRIDGAGSSTYLSAVRYGSSTFACAESAFNCSPGACPGTYPATCAETAPECDGPECDPETGNMTGNTRTGVTFRMSNTMSECDTFAETFGSADADGTYNLNPDCNPWTSGPGYCESTTDLCSRRVIVIPVVQDFGNGNSDPLMITRFALVYLEGYQGDCTGSSCEILGRFVKADISASALAGIYDEEALIHFTRLAE